MDGLDPGRQGLLQVLQDVAAGAVGRSVVQQLLERLQLDEHHHVLQEVALDEGGQVWRLQELEGGRTEEKRTSWTLSEANSKHQ